MAITPETREGRWTLALAAIFLGCLALDRVALASGHANFGPGGVIAYGTTGVLAVLYGLGAIIASRERSILVFASLGLVVALLAVTLLVARAS